VSLLQMQIQNPHKMHPLGEADVIGRVGVPGEGPYMQMFLIWNGETVSEASFTTYNCPIAIACGSWVTSWAEGRSLEVLSRIDPGDVEKILGEIPLGKEHCAALAVNALQDALRQWQARSEVAQ